MAKRKRRPGGGSKLRPIKNYRDDEFVPYIFNAEKGILMAWTAEPDIRDGDVRQALRDLISPIEKSGQLPEALTDENEDEDKPSYQLDQVHSDQSMLIQTFILSNLRQTFQEQGALKPEDLVGVLKVINGSVGTWNRGMRGQEYLKYIQDFLGGAGAGVYQLTEEQVKELGLEFFSDTDEED